MEKLDTFSIARSQIVAAGRLNLDIWLLVNILRAMAARSGKASLPVSSAFTYTGSLVRSFLLDWRLH